MGRTDARAVGWASEESGCVRMRGPYASKVDRRVYKDLGSRAHPNSAGGISVSLLGRDVK